MLTPLAVLTLLLDYLVFRVVWRLTGSIFDGQIAGRAVAVSLYFFGVRTRLFLANKASQAAPLSFRTLLIIGAPVSYAGIRIVTAFTPVHVPAAKLVLEVLLFLGGLAWVKDAEAPRKGEPDRGPKPGGGTGAWVCSLVLAIPVLAEVFGFHATGVLSQYVWEPIGGDRFLMYSLCFGAGSVASGLVARRYYRAAVVAGVVAGSFYAVGFGPAATILLYVFSCTVLGRVVFGRETEGPLALAAGASIWIAGMYLTLYLPVHYAGTHLALMALPLIAGYKQTRQLASEWLQLVKPADSEPSFAAFWAYALLAFLMVANWLIVLKPEVSTDGLAMHLVIPEDIARHHFFSIDFHQFIWALMPMGADLGYAAVYTSGGEYAARLLNFAMLCGVVLLLFRAARSFVPDSVAALLTALFVSTPLVYLTTGSLFVENTVAFMVLGSLIAIWRFHETRANRYLMLAAVLLGTSTALKLGALTAGVAGLVILVADFCRARLKRFPVAAAIALVIVLVVGSFPYVKAWRLTGNPFFPFQTGPFKSALVENDIRDERYNQPLNWRTPYRLTFETDQYFEGQPGSFGFQYLLFLPLLLAGLVAVRSFRNWSVIAISLVSALIIAVTQSNARYFYFLMPLLTLGTAPVLGWLREKQWRVFQAAVVVAILACLMNIRFLPAADWYHRDFYASPVLRAQGRDLYLHIAGPEREVVRFVNGIDRTEPVVLIDSSQIAGIEAPVHSVHWHDYAFLKQTAALQKPVDVFYFFGKEHVAHLIVEKTRQDRPAILTRLVDACGVPEFSSGTWIAMRLRPDCEQVLADAPQQH